MKSALSLIYKSNAFYITVCRYRSKKSLVKHLIRIVAMLLFSVNLYGQATAPAPAKTDNRPPALPFREVSGIVLDSTETPVIGATVTLTTAHDTLRTATNARGIFIIKNATRAIFYLSVKGIGYSLQVKKYSMNDLSPKLVLDPIVLKTDNRMLNEVKVDGSPSIVIKTDTVEYKASDYKVRENATLDELLSKMEGVEVDKRAGTVTFQGQEVKKAKVNGKDFNGGNVAAAIKNLPAEIIDKAQFVDDYGPNAARTGIKDGEPQKILNVTTKADRSIGQFLRATASAGNNDRYDEQAYLQRLNANQQIGLSGNWRNMVNGVGQGGGGSGNTTNGRPTIAYSDQWSKTVQVNSSYTYSYNNMNNLYSSYGSYFSSNGTTNYDNQSTGQNRTDGHNANVELQYEPSKTNYFRFNAGFNYSGTNNAGTSQGSLSGFQNQVSTSANTTSSKVPGFNGSVFYQHVFAKPKRNFSLTLSANNGSNDQYTERNARILYYDSLHVQKKDSLQHFIIRRDNNNHSYSGNVTFTEPLTATARLDFNGVVNYNGHDNTATTDSITKAGATVRANSLSNIYSYSLTETRLGLSYALTKKKFNLSLGFTAIPTVLQGTKVSLNASTYRTNFTVIPITRFEYIFSQTQRLSVNYSGAPQEPSFDQIQPVADRTNPQNVIIGNPDLSPSFRHSVNANYNNYVANSKLTLSVGGNLSKTNGQIITNTIQTLDPKLGNFDNEVHFLNKDGAWSANGNYSLAKQLNDKKYTLKYSGSVAYNHNISMSNNLEYHSDSWRFSQRFGPQINPAEWLELNPTISYNLARSFFTQPNARNTDTKTTALSIDGTFYLPKGWRINYDASKNYVEGVGTNVTQNPFVVNASIEHSFWAKRNLTLKVQAFDIFNQNNFVNQSVSESSVSYTNTNINSRYLFVSLAINLQKWSGTPKRNGIIMQRRGDGSFIY
ncbi:outer membrane beta-barrel protein [Mucilaginibacter sp. HMF5004]|uniref:outer membrane beta-barrel protein n=1 Tax=Mucilaginibacter rivuli TaxID=2857527 RepID=UPI001C5F0328|nr:outer membrane beta-barrel protein [Mucilaginibacter rivuli]MBW4890989.1 outer membrane beta-barrel protein [Mucilaginibacter rivuli]